MLVVLSDPGRSHQAALASPPTDGRSFDALAGPAVHFSLRFTRRAMEQRVDDGSAVEKDQKPRAARVDSRWRVDSRERDRRGRFARTTAFVDSDRPAAPSFAERDLDRNETPTPTRGAASQWPAAA
jgi:hypothetical protein